MSTGIAVVLVAHDSAPHVERLLGGLAPDVSSRPLTRVVVDNGSSDDLAARLSAYPDVRLVTQVNTGFAHGINRGVEAAPRDAHVLVLNPDVRIGVADVEALAGMLDRDAAAGRRQRGGLKTPRVGGGHAPTRPQVAVRERLPATTSGRR
jgi:N-acetylglucosaminyl-diphospho-decaprenol L-rhamnosyltransferase